MVRGSLKEVWSHIETINKEMGDVKTDVAVIKTEIKSVKEKLSSVKNLQWGIIGSIVVAIITQVIIKFNGG